MANVIQTFPAVAGNIENQTIDYEDFEELTPAEKDNGTAYFVPDVNIESGIMVFGNRFDKANIYTEDERMVGSYLGKPLYQKVITGLSYTPTVTSWSNTGVNIPNCERVISCGFGQSNGCFLYIAFCKCDNNGDLVAWFSTQIYEYQTMLVQYTKTTDGTVSVGTGNDYSTDEQIIGTWIDGKKLYQKTISCGGLKNNDALSVNHNIADIDKVFIVGGFALNSSGNSIPISYYDVLYPQYSVRTSVNKTQILIRTAQDMSEYTESYVTLQYTKTED